MKNKLLIIIVVILSLILIFMPKNQKKMDVVKTENKQIIVNDTESDKKIKKDLEEYVVGVVAAEMPATFSYEAIKAQAIVSRTYAYYKMQNNLGNDYDIMSDISDQAYIDIDKMKEKWQEEFSKYYIYIKNAVNETKDEIILYDEKPIEAFYFSMSNGYTENASTVFQQDLPYISSVESTWDNNTLNNYEVSTELSTDEFCKKLDIHTLPIVINSQNKDSTGRTADITINNKNFQGTDFRKKLNLRSTDFSLEINDDIIIITTKGYGHGVGMSQYGANGMAKEGYNCYDIIKYYYKNVDIGKI